MVQRLYEDHRGLRARLLAELRERHPHTPDAERLRLAQTILDRIVFLALAEQRQRLPFAATTRARGLAPSDPNVPISRWAELVAVFHRVGDALGGELFRRDPALEALTISDAMCEALAALWAHDLRDAASVDALGHIFEQSIAEPAKRKREGIFYTPALVTSMVVRETLGRAFADAWARASHGRSADPQDAIATWEAYQQQLHRLRVLDPACGSGAFLLAAVRVLVPELQRAERALAELRGPLAPACVGPLAPGCVVPLDRLFGIDQSGESVDVAKRSLWLELAERAPPLGSLDRTLRRGNSVVSDPQVDPWAFDWAAEGWPERFDVVLGNPPFVRQEHLGHCKDHWRRCFPGVYHGTADLFVYFFARAILQLAPGGRLGFVVSNKWLRGRYAAKLRTLLARDCTIERLVDFGHAPLFPGADAFPCIITLRKAAPPPGHAVGVTLHPPNARGTERLASPGEPLRFALPQAGLGATGWTLEPPAAQALLAKLRAQGVPLREHTPVKPYRGVLTGCNAAFVVDQATRDRLCREDPRSAEILVKTLRGQDIARWVVEWAGQWLIFARRGIDIERYPAVLRHLEHHRAALEPRPKGHAGEGWPGRKPGGYRWYELQDAVDYYESFAGPKLLYQEIQFHPAYALDRAGYFLNNKGYLLRGDDTWLLAVLNSPAMWWHNWRTLVHLKDEALSPAGDKLVDVPIPPRVARRADAVEAAVEAVVRLAGSAHAATAELLERLRTAYDVEAPGRRLGRLAGLDRDGFVHEVRRRRARRAAPLSAAGLAELEALYERAAPGIDAMRAEILAHERTIAAAVHAAYGLTPADLALLRATQPPRMPPGW